MIQRLGLELLDGMVPVARFVVPTAVAENPFCLGREGHVILPFPGVLAIHAVFSFYEGHLWAASASDRAPAIVAGKALPTGDWTEIPIPCVVRLGRIAVRPFLARQASPKTFLPTPASPFVVQRPYAPATVMTPTIAVPHARARRPLMPAFVSDVASQFAGEWSRAPLVAKLAVAVVPAIAILAFVGR
jgi:hypothetical protein